MLVYVNWDGFSYDLYERAKNTGPGMPNLDRMLQTGAVLCNHYCGIPAITNPMQQTLVSGAWPKDTGNCYVFFDHIKRCAVQTLRLNRCENICEAARRNGKHCASVHGWYFENRGCVEKNLNYPYIQNNLRNFEDRVEETLAYLSGKPVHSGGELIAMKDRPDFLSIYADDIDTVCHNGTRLPYDEITQAASLAQWYENLIYTVQRMDRALGPLLNIPQATLALAADHGGMPFGVPLNGETAEEAGESKSGILAQAISDAGIYLHVLRSPQDTPPDTAQAVLLPVATQAQLYYLQPVKDALKAKVMENVLSLSFIHQCLDQAQQASWGAGPEFGDLYITTRAPYHFVPNISGKYVGGSHAAMEESCLHVFCAFAGQGIKQGVRVTDRTDLTGFAPTLCRLMGFDGPANKTGNVLRQVLEDNK
jgi:predicted AlkP superfamily pyrophosphatase or phosphodiesterase